MSPPGLTGCPRPRRHPARRGLCARHRRLGGRRTRDRRGQRRPRSGQGRKDHADRVGPGDPRRYERRNHPAEPGVREEVPQRADQAGGAELHRSEDHAQARRLRQQPARRHPGQPGLPGHGLLRPGRAAHPARQLRRDLRLEHPLPEHRSSTSTESPPTAPTSAADGSTASPRPASSSASTTTRTCCGRRAWSRRRPGASSPPGSPASRSGANCPSSSATSTSTRPSTPSECSRTSTPPPRPATPCSAAVRGFDTAATKNAAATLPTG